MTWMSAMPPFVIQVLVPLMTHSSLASSYLAEVRSELTSDPASASETAKAAVANLSGVPKHCGIHSPICSGVPLPRIPATPSVVPMMARPMPASPQNSSSRYSGNVRPVGSENALALNSNPYRPISAACSRIGQGISSLRSYSWAAGRMTVSAKSWTHFWIWSWSSLRSRVKSLMAGHLGKAGHRQVTGR